MLSIKNLHVAVSGKKILKGLNLNIQAGEVHAIMGPNGSGKSTLSKVLAGHPAYEITQGEIIYEHNLKKINLLDLEPHERARAGIFLAFQYPVEVPGVMNATFLRASFNAICKAQGLEEMDALDFEALLEDKRNLLGMSRKFIERSLNVDFSGGEKKRNEILQMAILNPRLALLDETDSGLDVDSLRIVSDGINTLKNSSNAFVVITHYHRILEHIKPDFVHILKDGQILETGGEELALSIEQRGYDWIA